MRFNLPISDAAAERILAVPGVNSVAEGLAQGDRAVIVGIDSPGVADDPRIPNEIEGLPVVTEVEGRAGVAAAQPPLLGEDTPPASLPRPVSADTVIPHRPIPPGVSIGHRDVSAGTSSFLATDGGRIYQLSNSHVLALNGKAAQGDPILQPGAADGGGDPDRVGGLAGFVPLRATGNRVDLAWYQPEVEVSADIFGEPAPPIADAADPELGEQVAWIGRTSGLSRATVDRINVAVEVGESRRVFTEQFRLDTPLRPGDSGSPVIRETEDGPVPVGVGFAATNVHGFCNTATNVEEESGLSIVVPRANGDGGQTPARGGLGSTAGLLLALGLGAAYLQSRR